MATFEKQGKTMKKKQAEVDRSKAILAEKERKTNPLEERLNSTKTLDELKERESELRR